MHNLLSVLLRLQIAIALIFYRLFVITKVWAYIVVPLGAPHIGMWGAFGLQLLISAVRSSRPNFDQTQKQVNIALANSALEISIVWLLAYLIFA